MDGKMYCSVCGTVDEHYDENSLVHHNDTPKHTCNKILETYKHKRRTFSRNREGISVLGTGESEPMNGVEKYKVENTDHQKIRILAKPSQPVKFSFTIINDMRTEDFLIVGIQLAHPQPQFVMCDHPYIFGGEPKIIKKKATIKDQLFVTFKASEIGIFEMPIMFTFHRRSDEKNIIIIREMVVSVYEEDIFHPKCKSPYTSEEWGVADYTIKSSNLLPYQITYKIPKLLKLLLPHGIEEKALENIKAPREIMEKLQLLIISTRVIFDEGPTKNNYMAYFHHLLWWEEIVATINLRKFNMSSVLIELRNDNYYYLEVPGLAEKRPSLLRGDRVYLRPRAAPTLVFESSIKDIDDCHIQLTNLDQSFNLHYSKESLFDVRFIMSRVPRERMHEAVNSIFSSKQESLVFPVGLNRRVAVRPIEKFHNTLIKNNEEQRSAVEHIVSSSSGRAPYIVFGPPGTGKTMTIVEAIVQLVVRSSRNRIMVCTDSNMAADHIAVMLLKYNKTLNINNFLLRANSQSREWTVMPPELAPVSNGTSYQSFYSVSNVCVSKYRIFVTTLLHAAKYGSPKSQSAYKLQMTHLFIDEAAQASEPASLVPITGLLSPTGHLVLAGDPKQLGPVCMSREAKDRGLGTSLMERLKLTYEKFYDNDPYYTVMLVKNFRSDRDILAIPNELFYDNCLEFDLLTLHLNNWSREGLGNRDGIEKATEERWFRGVNNDIYEFMRGMSGRACVFDPRPLAEPDPLSKKSILNMPGGDRAIVFHAVNSKEQRMGNAPSFFNEKELDMIKKYIKALINEHQVSPKDIGVIAPYIRQVYKVKGWLKSSQYEDIEVGTVESFQGKEKRVILVSTVRANCRLLDYDAKYGLGFLVDDKRYNVTLTRAKAKLIIIGNPTCLTRDVKWRKYMSLCSDFNCYFGQETEQLTRSSQMLIDIARTRFDKCRLSEELKKKK